MPAKYQPPASAPADTVPAKPVAAETQFSSEIVIDGDEFGAPDGGSDEASLPNSGIENHIYQDWHSDNADTPGEPGSDYLGEISSSYYPEEDLDQYGGAVDGTTSIDDRPAQDAPPNPEDHVDAYNFEFSENELNDLSRFRVQGWIVNQTDRVWSEEYSLGIRNFRDSTGELIRDVEFRGVLGSSITRPGDVTHFIIDLDPAQIPYDAATCEIDMVREGWYWFSERGASAVVVPVTGFQNPYSNEQTLIALSRIAMLANDGERKKIAVIQQSLRSHNFGRYDRISELRRLLNDCRQGLPYRQPPLSSKGITASLGERLGAPRRDSFFQAFSSRISASQGQSEEGPLGQLAIFRRFVKEGTSFFRNSTPPFSFKFAQWLNGRALPSELASSPISRSMIATLGANSTFNFERPHDFRNLVWQYATSVMIDGKMPADLLPDTVIRELATSPPATDPNERFPRPTGFMQRLLNEDQNYKNRYETVTPSGRCSYAFDLLLLAMENEARRVFLGEDVLKWMTEPVGPSLSASPFEILAMANMGWRDTSYLASQDASLPDELRILRESYDWLPPVPAAEGYPVRVIGRHTSQSGLGTNMRMTIRALEALNIAVEVVDCDFDKVTPPERANRTLKSRPIDIYHLNCDDIPALVSRYASRARPEPYRIAFALWEASVMPEQHRSGALLMDEIWVPTQYLKDVYEQEGFDNVHVVGKGIDISEVEPISRATYGLDQDDFVFLTSFDLDSWVERKNPAAVVEAFAQAFPSDPTVRLVIKTTGIFSHPGDRTRQVARLLAAADRDPRITLINDRMPFGRYLGVIQMADALISAHRSEGFGYLPAYAMMLGRPVIVTDHSGTQDFCDAETAFPVATDLVPIPQGDFVYEVKGAHWADIKVDALAQEMLRVRNDSNESAQRAIVAMARVNERYSYEALSDRYRQRISEIG